MKRVASVVVALALVSGPAHAQSSGQAAGRAHFKKGVELYRDGSYAAALVEFNAAYADAPSPIILFNIGQTCAELKDYACAVRAFEKYAASPNTPRAKRATAKDELKRLGPYVSQLYVTVNVEGAALTLDDAPIGTSPLPEPVLVNAGRHTLGATKTPLFPARQALDVAGGLERVDVRLDLVEPPPPPAAKVIFVTKPPPPEKSRLPLWLGLGATGVFAAAGTTFGILTLSAKSDLEQRADRFGVTRSELADAESRQNTFALVADVAFGATILAAGITTVVLLLRRP